MAVHLAFKLALTDRLLPFRYIHKREAMVAGD